MERTKLKEIYDKHINAYLMEYRKARFEDIPTRIFIDAMEEALRKTPAVCISEQSFCECPNNFEIYQETKTYHSGCNKEVKVIRTK